MGSKIADLRAKHERQAKNNFQISTALDGAKPSCLPAAARSPLAARRPPPAATPTRRCSSAKTSLDGGELGRPKMRASGRNEKSGENMNEHYRQSSIIRQPLPPQPRRHRLAIVSAIRKGGREQKSGGKRRRRALAFAFCALRSSSGPTFERSAVDDAEIIKSSDAVRIVDADGERSRNIRFWRAAKLRTKLQPRSRSESLACLRSPKKQRESVRTPRRQATN